MLNIFRSSCRCVWKALRNKRCDSYSGRAVDAENKPLFAGEVFLLGVFDRVFLRISPKKPRQFLVTSFPLCYRRIPTKTTMATNLSSVCQRVSVQAHLFVWCPFASISNETFPLFKPLRSADSETGINLIENLGECEFRHVSVAFS